MRQFVALKLIASFIVTCFIIFTFGPSIEKTLSTIVIQLSAYHRILEDNETPSFISPIASRVPVELTTTLLKTQPCHILSLSWFEYSRVTNNLVTTNTIRSLEVYNRYGQLFGRNLPNTLNTGMFTIGPFYTTIAPDTTSIQVIINYHCHSFWVSQDTLTWKIK